MYCGQFIRCAEVHVFVSISGAPLFGGVAGEKRCIGDFVKTAEIP